LITYAINTVEAAFNTPIIVGSAIVGYLLLARFIKSIPGVVGALVFGVIAAFATDAFAEQDMTFEWVWPEITTPELDILAILAVGIPLALVIQAENTQSMGILIANGYKPPVNSITTISGVASLIVAPFGGHNASIAGPMTAICGSREAGEKIEKRYGSVIINGTIFVLFGIFASVSVVLITILPGQLVTALAGLAMLTVLVSAFRGAFADNRFKLGAIVALVIGLSGMSLFGISAPFWALVLGLITSMLLEQEDFRYREEQTPTAT
jgi:benzoate membrane transport protein